MSKIKTTQWIENRLNNWEFNVDDRFHFNDVFKNDILDNVCKYAVATFFEYTEWSFRPVITDEGITLTLMDNNFEDIMELNLSEIFIDDVIGDLEFHEDQCRIKDRYVSELKRLLKLLEDKPTRKAF